MNFADTLNFETVTIPLIWGYWHQRADERLGNPPQGASRCLCNRQEWRTPKRTIWQCTASVCSALLGISLG